MASSEAEGSGRPRLEPDSWRESTPWQVTWPWPPGPWPRLESECCRTSGCLEEGSITRPREVTRSLGWLYTRRGQLGASIYILVAGCS